MKRLQGLRVLVIDDDVAVSRAMAALLGSFGASPVTAATIDEALARFDENQADVVISDLRLGAESGIDAIGRLRKAAADLPALLITGDTGAEQMREVHASGLEVLHKPVHPALLEKTLVEVVHAR